ncbi:hypothetical protein FOCC_FOCC003182 [Frankliniella occidentalis]|nr:hypothetical protein FOCC_FOCC003182 [Frankliniella occidentalis]
MWWNILPSLIITGGLVYIPGVAVPILGWIWTGSAEGRDRSTNLDLYKIFRDKRLLNNEDPYRQHKHLGLDGIPDN